MSLNRIDGDWLCRHQMQNATYHYHHYHHITKVSMQLHTSQTIRNMRALERGAMVESAASCVLIAFGQIQY